MSHDSTPDGEFSLTVLSRTTQLRSLFVRTGCRTRSFDLARSLRALTQLGAGLARRPADDATAMPRFLAEATRRILEHAERKATRQS
jgi:hypothetical protein